MLSSRWLLLCWYRPHSPASFTESIDSTWADRWHHSSLEKYNGRFVAEAPPGSQDVALKVIGLLALLS